ncbi:hypothetical protein EC968_007010 [Mortierella alpina]|nr:hypothetical protein EC968_007010 [Mortierella alpina]
MPEGSTIDAALMNHAEKQPFLVRRYASAQSGSCYLNLPPEVTPGTYSLLLTVYKKRTAVVLGRSLVPVIQVVNNKGVLKVPRQVQTPSLATLAGTSSQDHIEPHDERRTLLQPSAAVKSKFDGTDGSWLNTALDPEKIHVVHEAGGKVRVRRTPYTFGWTLPEVLQEVPHARADILLVKTNSERTVERVLATNLNAHAGFHVVFLPMT